MASASLKHISLCVAILFVPLFTTFIGASEDGSNEPIKPYAKNPWYWEFHDELFKNGKQLNDKKVREIASGLDLDADEIMIKMKSREIQNIINRDVRDAINAGVRGTPAVYINGKKLKSRSIRSFQNQIDVELKKDINSGSKARTKK